MVAGLATCATVYPRVCGGATSTSGAEDTIHGLSPRVRGSQGCQSHGWRAIGSIPACAGEPSRTNRSIAVIWVYPRVCGGAGTSSLH